METAPSVRNGKSVCLQHDYEAPLGFIKITIFRNGYLSTEEVLINM